MICRFFEFQCGVCHQTLYRPVDLVIVEPVVQQPGDLLGKKALVYPVRFSVFRPETRGSSPSSPPDDLDSDNPRTKRRPRGADSSNDQGPCEAAASEDRGEGAFQAGPSGILHGEDAVESDYLPAAPCSPKASMAAEIVLVTVEVMPPSVPEGTFTAAAPHAGVSATSLAPVPASQGIKAASVPQKEIAPASVTERVVTASGAHDAPSSAPVPADPLPANDQGSRGNSAVEGSRDEEVLQARPFVPGIQLGVDTVEAEGLPVAPYSPEDSPATELSLEAAPPSVPEHDINASVAHASTTAPVPTSRVTMTPVVPQEETGPIIHVGVLGADPAPDCLAAHPAGLPAQQDLQAAGLSDRVLGCLGSAS
jgi:hypothetical protein